MKSVRWTWGICFKDVDLPTLVLGRWRVADEIKGGEEDPDSARIFNSKHGSFYRRPRLLCILNISSFYTTTINKINGKYIYMLSLYRVSELYHALIIGKIFFMIIKSIWSMYIFSEDCTFMMGHHKTIFLDWPPGSRWMNVTINMFHATACISTLCLKLWEVPRVYLFHLIKENE